VLLGWNEGRSVRLASALGEGEKLVVPVLADKVNPGNDGKLVHLTGQAVTEQTLADPEFGVSLMALKLKRMAEMFQWVEHSSKTSSQNVGGSTTTKTTYTYKQEWRSEAVNSARFKHPEGHENPPTLRYPGREVFAHPITVGALSLSSALVGRLQNWSPQPIPPTEAWPETIKREGKAYQDYVYFGVNPGSPTVGDTRISFQAVFPCRISVIARQVGGSFEPFVAKTGNQIEMLVMGEHSAMEMFQQARKTNTLITWGIRAGGTLGIWFGFLLLFSPLQVLASFIPVLGRIVGFGAGLLAMVCALPLAAIVISAAWFWYRPWLAISLVLIAAGAVFFILKWRRSKSHAV